MNDKNFASMLSWNDGVIGSYGPGVSRPKDGERTKLFTVMVRQQQAKPMKVSLHAKSKADAMKFARNRWPGAAVEVAA
jgi:hypothetical protein